MKHCNTCNTDFPDNLSFCTKCGSKLTYVQSNHESESNSRTDNRQSPSIKTKKKGGSILKRILIGIVAIVVILFLWGSHIINSTTYMTFNTQNVLFAKSGGETEVNIDYDGYVWEVSYKPSWIDIDEYDNRFTIRCSPNKTGRDREDHITIKSGKIVQALPVGQYGATRYIRLSESRVASDMDGGSIYVNMESDGNGPEISYPKFCKIADESSEGFTLVVEDNDGYSRTGTLYVKEDNVTASIYIFQKGKCSDCGGDGQNTCPSCAGLGSTGWGMYSMSCFTCGGKGYVNCYSCRGTGIR